MLFLPRNSHLFGLTKTCIRNYSSESLVKLQGWIQKAHRKGPISFVHLSSDPTSDSIQIVVPKSICRNFSIGGAATVSGKWVKSIGPGQEQEVLADEFTVLHTNQFQPQQGNFHQLRNKMHLRFKHPAVASVVKLRSKLNFHTHKYFVDKGFCHIDTPLISLNDCEGGAQAFELTSRADDEFFGPMPVYLPVSGQLHLEAVCSSIPNVYTMNTAFRAEKSLTRQHLAEFRMLEVECAFIDSLDGICSLVEDYIKFIVSVVKQECTDDVLRLQQLLPNSEPYLSVKAIEEFNIDRPFPRVSYNEAVKTIESKGGNVSKGFSRQQELELVDFYKGPIFVQRFPSSQKPFYMRFNDNNEAECFDLLFPMIGELAGGSIREYDIEKLKARQLPPNLEWYLELREAGYPRSSGFGLGFDRLMQFLFSIGSIKDTIPFPRWYKHCSC